MNRLQFVGLGNELGYSLTRVLWSVSLSARPTEACQTADRQDRVDQSSRGNVAPSVGTVPRTRGYPKMRSSNFLHDPNSLLFAGPYTDDWERGAFQRRPPTGLTLRSRRARWVRLWKHDLQARRLCAIPRITEVQDWRLPWQNRNCDQTRKRAVRSTRRVSHGPLPS